MRKLIKILIVLIIVSISLFTAFSSLSISNPPSSEGFSVKNTLNDLKHIAKAPHPTGSEEHDKVRDYIVKRLEQLGTNPLLQKAYAENNSKFGYSSGDVQNIIGRLKGTNPNSKAILLSAHYDSTPRGPGASDDGVGVASLLETLRVLKEGPQLKNDIIILLTDDEENAMLGAAAFVKEHPYLKDVGVIINFEARGNRGPYIMFETAENNAWYIEQFKKASILPVAYSFSYDVYRFMDNDTDFTLFKQAGLKGLNFATLLGYETYHMETDTVENISMDSIQHAGSNALAMARQFGNMDLLKPHNDGNSVYFTAARSVLVVYPESLVIPLCLVTLLLLAAFIYLGSKRRLLSLKGIAFGFLIGFIPIISCAVIGFALQSLYEALFGKITSMEEYTNYIHTGDIGMIVLVILTVALTLLIYKLFSKKFTYINLLSGSLTIWMILSIISSFMLKSSSYLFTLPLIITLIGMFITMITKTSSK